MIQTEARIKLEDEVVHEQGYYSTPIQELRDDHLPYHLDQMQIIHVEHSDL